MLCNTIILEGIINIFWYIFVLDSFFNYLNFQKTHSTSTEKTKKVAIAAVDTVLWQTFASVLIPGFTINRFCFFSKLLLQKSTKLPTNMRKWTVTCLGLATIPFIVHPIDSFVEEAMDKTARKIYNEPTISNKE